MESFAVTSKRFSLERTGDFASSGSGASGFGVSFATGLGFIFATDFNSFENSVSAGFACFFGGAFGGTLTGFLGDGLATFVGCGFGGGFGRDTGFGVDLGGFATAAFAGFFGSGGGATFGASTFAGGFLGLLGGGFCFFAGGGVTFGAATFGGAGFFGLAIFGIGGGGGAACGFGGGGGAFGLASCSGFGGALVSSAMSTISTIINCSAGNRSARKLGSPNHATNSTAICRPTENVMPPRMTPYRLSSGCGISASSATLEKPAALISPITAITSP